MPSLGTGRIKAYLWGLYAGFVVHNIEEVILLPQWMVRHGGFAPSATRGEFAFAVLFLSIAVGIVFLMAESRGLASPAAWGVVMIASGLLANAVSHLAISVVTWSIMPGLVSGTLLVTPLATGLLSGIARRRILGLRSFVLCIIAGVLAMPLLAGLALEVGAVICSDAC